MPLVQINDSSEYPRHGCCEGTEYELIRWKSQVLGNSFSVAESKKLFDHTRILIKCRFGPASLDGFVDVVFCS